MSTPTSASGALQAVLNHPGIWRGNDCAQVAHAGVATGFAELDTVLPGGGWPVGALTEIYAERKGVGELQLVMPAAAALTRAGRWVTFVAAPHVPYAPAVAAAGVALERLLMIDVPAVDERLWSAEQALRASCSSAVLLWIDHAHERALRRLQLAAEEGATTLFLFRSPRATPATTAALRLHLARAHNRTIVRVLKRRGGGLPAPIALDLHPWIRFSASASFPRGTPAIAGAETAACS
jgi:cell division inhibitor SulA/protein ImuA